VYAQAARAAQLHVEAAVAVWYGNRDGGRAQLPRVFANGTSCRDVVRRSGALVVDILHTGRAAELSQRTMAPDPRAPDRTCCRYAQSLNHPGSGMFARKIGEAVVAAGQNGGGFKNQLVAA